MSLDSFSWAIGLFEGEGCITSAQRLNGFRYPRIQISMTCKDVIDRWEQVFPGGCRHTQHPERQKPLYMYAIQAMDAVERFLLIVQPYLGIKKSKECEVALRLIAESRTRRAPGSSKERPISRKGRLVNA